MVSNSTTGTLFYFTLISSALLFCTLPLLNFIYTFYKRLIFLTYILAAVLYALIL